MNITNRTVSFREGQAVSDHAIFEDANGVEFIAEPGPVQRWLKLSDIKKPRHDRVQFLRDAEKRTGIQATPEVMAEAFAHTKANQRVVSPKPLKVQVPVPPQLDKDGQPIPGQSPKFVLVDNK